MQFQDLKIASQMDDIAYWLRSATQGLVDSLDYAIDGYEMVGQDDDGVYDINTIVSDAEVACDDIKIVLTELSLFDRELNKLIALRVKLGNMIDRPFTINQ